MECKVNLYTSTSIPELFRLCTQRDIDIRLRQQREVELIRVGRSDNGLSGLKLFIARCPYFHGTSLFYNDTADLRIRANHAALIYHQLRQSTCKQFATTFGYWHSRAHQRQDNEFDPDTTSNLVGSTTHV